MLNPSNELRLDNLPKFLKERARNKFARRLQFGVLFSVPAKIDVRSPQKQMAKLPRFDSADVRAWHKNISKYQVSLTYRNDVMPRMVPFRALIESNGTETLVAIQLGGSGFGEGSQPGFRGIGVIGSGSQFGSSLQGGAGGNVFGGSVFGGDLFGPQGQIAGLGHDFGDAGFTNSGGGSKIGRPGSDGQDDGDDDTTTVETSSSTDNSTQDSEKLDGGSVSGGLGSEGNSDDAPHEDDEPLVDNDTIVAVVAGLESIATGGAGVAGSTTAVGTMMGLGSLASGAARLLGAWKTPDPDGEGGEGGEGGHGGPKGPRSSVFSGTIVSPTQMFGVEGAWSSESSTLVAVLSRQGSAGPNRGGATVFSSSVVDSEGDGFEVAAGWGFARFGAPRVRPN